VTPINGGKRDFANAKKEEIRAAFEIAYRWSCHISIQPEMSKFDYILGHDEKGLVCNYALGEFRGRAIKHIYHYDSDGGIVIDVDKVEGANMAAKVMGTENIFYFVRCNDGSLHYTSIHESRVPSFTYDGNFKRNVEERYTDGKKDRRVYKILSNLFRKV
jgi:hypothetical protein